MNTSFADIEKKENRKDLIISICVFLSGFSCFAQLYYFQPLLPDLAKDFILSASESSFAISFSTLGMVFGLFTTMFVADRIPRKKMIGTGLLSSSIFSVAASFSPTFPSADFAQCCQRFSIIRSHIRIHGLHCGRGIVPQQRENHGSVYRRKRIGRYGRTSHFILDRSPLHLADRIGQHRFDLRLIRHTVLTVQPPLHQLYAPQGKLPYPHHSKSPTDHLKSIDPFLPDRRMILGVFVSLYNYLGFYLTKAPFNFPEHYIHYIYLMYIFGIFGSIATAGLTRYFTHFKVLKAMFLVSAAGILLLYITDFRVVTLGLAVFTFNFFVVHVLCNRIVSDYNLSKRSVTISIYLLTYYLGSSLLGWGTGVILDTWGWQYFLGSLILILLINYGIVTGGIKRMRADLS